MIEIAYYRRSIEDEKKQIQSIPKQKDWCEKITKQRGIKIDISFQDTKSAKIPGREEFNEMMKYVHNASEPVRIWAWRISRLARNPIDEGSVKYAFIQGKIKEIIGGDREYKEGANQILMGVDFGEATEKSLQLARDVIEGMGKKNEKGWRPSMTPLGYINEPHGLQGDRKIFKDPDRWNHMRQAWDWLLSGVYNVPAIKGKLDERGFVTKNGKKVSKSVLYNSFSNRFYCGEYKWRGKWYTGAHPPMITEDEYDKAQFIIERPGKPRNRKHEHSFTGIIHCDECGSFITAEPPKYKKSPITGKISTYHHECPV